LGKGEEEHAGMEKCEWWGLYAVLGGFFGEIRGACFGAGWKSVCNINTLQIFSGKIWICGG
jgi:hypothetical protein